MENIININMDKVIPYANNPRNNSKSIDKVASSIKEFGFKQPLVLDKDNVIVVGHTRFEAAKKLGYIEVPCIIADDLTDSQIKAYRLADNKVAESSEWNLDKLELELEELKDIGENMEEYGFLKLQEESEEYIEDQEETIKEKFELLIECENEIDLQEKYEKLSKEGYQCKISTL